MSIISPTLSQSTISYIYPDENGNYVFTSTEQVSPYFSGYRWVIYKHNPNGEFLVKDVPLYDGNSVSFTQDELPPLTVNDGTSTYYTISLYYKIEGINEQNFPNGIYQDKGNFRPVSSKPETPTIITPVHYQEMGSTPLIIISSYRSLSTIGIATNIKIWSDNWEGVNYTTEELGTAPSTVHMTYGIVDGYTGCPLNTKLYVTARYKSSSGEWSEWAPTISFFGHLTKPTKPWILNLSTKEYIKFNIYNGSLIASEFQSNGYSSLGISHWYFTTEATNALTPPDNIYARELYVKQIRNPISGAKTADVYVWGALVNSFNITNLNILELAELYLSPNKIYYVGVKYEEYLNSDIIANTSNNTYSERISDFSGWNQIKTGALSPSAPEILSTSVTYDNKIEAYLKGYNPSTNRLPINETEFIISTSIVPGNSYAYVYQETHNSYAPAKDLYHVISTELGDYTSYFVHARFRDTDWNWGSYVTSELIRTFIMPPKRPTPIEPIANKTEVGIQSFLISSPFDSSSTLGSVDFEVSTDKTNFSSPTWSGTNYSIVSNGIQSGTMTATGGSGNILLKNTNYYWRVKYTDVNGTSSSWMYPSKFKTQQNYVPDKPSIFSIGTATSFPIGNISITPTIVSSVFSSYDGTEIHKHSDWQIATDGSFANIVRFLSQGTANLESWTVPTALTSGSVQYWVRVRHADESQISDWSDSVRFLTAYKIPNQPTAKSPIHNGTGYYLDINLISSAYDGDDVHTRTDWEINTSSTFDPSFVVFSYTGTNGTSLVEINVNVGSSNVLNYASTYYWRARYYNSSGASLWTSDGLLNNTRFRTIFSVPNKPTNSTPINNGTSISQTPSLIASTMSGSGSHLYSQWRITLGTSGDAIVWFRTSIGAVIGTVVGTNAGTFTSELLNNNYKLDAFEEYYWQVRYKNERGWSDWSDPTWFQTVQVIPNTPSTLLPLGGARKVPVGTGQLYTSTSYINNGTHTASNWEIYLNDGTGTLVWYDYNNPTNLTSTTLNSGTWAADGKVGYYSGFSPGFSGGFGAVGSTPLDQVRLTQGIEYKWRVAHQNSAGTSAWSPLSTFTTLPDTAPAPIFIGTATEDILTTTTFSINEWVGGTCGQHLSTYWEIATGTSFGTGQLVLSSYENLNNLNSWTVSNLENYTKYYVRAKFENDAGYSSWSNLRQFRTIVNVPQKPINISPGNNSVGQQWLTPIALSANSFVSTETPQFRSQTDSQWQISNDSNFSNIVWNNTVGSGIFTTITVGSGALTNYKFKTLYWRTRYQNIGGWSDWSDTFNFRTLPGKPNKPEILIPENFDDNFEVEDGIITSSNYISAGTHLKSQWQIFTGTSGTSSTDIAWEIRSSNEPSYLTSILVNNTIGLFKNACAGRTKLFNIKDYLLRVRYQNENTNESQWSDWSDLIQIRTTYDVPNSPTGLYPLESADDISKNSSLIASEFSGNGTHLATKWEISRNSDFSNLIWKSEITSNASNDLTTVVVNDVTGVFYDINSNVDYDLNSLFFGTTYYWRTSYKNEEGYSNWSIPIIFETRDYDIKILNKAPIDKKIEYLIKRFVHPHIEKRHPKFKKFIEHWLRFLDTNNNKLIFNMSDFNTISEFYSYVEIFDWANEIKNAHFENFMLDNSLEVLQDIYFDTNINPEILRFFRSLNTRKGSPISFQILMKALGYTVTVTTDSPYNYTVTETNGAINTTAEINKFIEVIKLFHPAGMNYTTSLEILFPITQSVAGHGGTWIHTEHYTQTQLLTGAVLATVRESISNIDFSKLNTYTYEDFFDSIVVHNIEQGKELLDLGPMNVYDITTGSSLYSGGLFPAKFKRRVQRQCHFEQLSGGSGTSEISQLGFAQLYYGTSSL